MLINHVLQTSTLFALLTASTSLMANSLSRDKQVANDDVTKPHCVDHQLLNSDQVDNQSSAVKLS